MNSASLQLRVELEVHGLNLTDGSYNHHGSRTSSDQLDQLLRYQNAWLNLRFDGPIKQSLQDYSICELREGNYAIVFSSTNSSQTHFDSLQTIPLSSLDSPVLTTFRTDFQDFTVDFGQDLAVLASNDPHDPQSLEIKLVSLKTGLSHPLAQTPAFYAKAGFEISRVGDSSFSFEVMNDVLVAQVEGINRQGYEIFAWNWKSCTLLARIGSQFGAASFIFLDTAHMAVCSSGKDEGKNDDRLCRITISLYSLSTAANEKTPGPTVFHAAHYTCTCPVIVFQFPELTGSYQLSFHGLFRSAPIPGRAIPAVDNAFTYLKAHTLGLSFTLVPLDGGLPDSNPIHLRIFISASHLRRHLTRHAGQTNTAYIAWHEWGTQATRWFSCDKAAEFWPFWTFGSRFVRIGEGSYSTLQQLSIYDFNPRTIISRPGSKLNIPIHFHYTPYLREELSRVILGGRGLVTPHVTSSIQGQSRAPQLFVDTIDSSMPTVIERGFSSPVESRLPYRVVSRPHFAPACLDWFMDDSHIIGRNATNARNHAGAPGLQAADLTYIPFMVAPGVMEPGFCASSESWLCPPLTIV